jgi:hypothetical protein
VIEAQLKKGGGEWLVGDKCSYADLAFVPWYWLCPAIMGEGFDKVSSSCDWCGRARCADSSFSARNGSPSTRPAGRGTRGCRRGLRSRRLGRTGRRRWPSNCIGSGTGELLEATRCIRVGWAVYLKRFLSNMRNANDHYVPTSCSPGQNEVSLNGSCSLADGNISLA